MAAAAIAVLPVALMVGFGHQGVHGARSIVVPGAGLLEADPPLAILFMALATVATLWWLRWGCDWIVALIVGAAVVASMAWGTTIHSDAPADVTVSAHEFPFVVIVAGLAGWLRSVLAGVPGLRWFGGRRSARERQLVELSVVDRCRAAALLGLAERSDAAVVAAIQAPDVERRARRVGLVARWRRGGDPFRVDHAPTRAALALTGSMDDRSQRRFVRDAERSRAGVPASEPTWVRTFDATLAAVALEELGHPGLALRWRSLLQGPLAMRRGHRPAWWWSPLGIAAGRCLDWEHAAATAIAHERGWIGDADWIEVRQRVLGAAARGSARRNDERLIASGRMWLALVDDPVAERIVGRPTIGFDPLAVGLDRLAQHFHATRAEALQGGTK